MKQTDTYSLDEKMGQTYIREDMANTLCRRDCNRTQVVSVKSDNLNGWGGETVWTTSKQNFMSRWSKNLAQTLVASDQKDPPVVVIISSED